VSLLVFLQVLCAATPSKLAFRTMLPVYFGLGVLKIVLETDGANSAITYKIKEAGVICLLELFHSGKTFLRRR
jgi:hypothetical protein